MMSSPGSRLVFDTTWRYAPCAFIISATSGAIMSVFPLRRSVLGATIRPTRKLEIDVQFFTQLAESALLPLARIDRRCRLQTTLADVLPVARRLDEGEPRLLQWRQYARRALS